MSVPLPVLLIPSAVPLTTPESVSAALLPTSTVLLASSVTLLARLEVPVLALSVPPLSVSGSSVA